MLIPTTSGSACVWEMCDRLFLNLESQRRWGRGRGGGPRRTSEKYGTVVCKSKIRFCQDPGKKIIGNVICALRMVFVFLLSATQKREDIVAKKRFECWGGCRTKNRIYQIFFYSSE
ncbi:hypothetical protein TNIN_355571 [Trichonephila inaurata madagascariensis]|uniref:Uncharacterized protein n=1 Tax=Trichonephila inaurata madagascariensis TaxID=2747483 RepID=A0A8X6X2Q7_9ARAC|nr:hypothetical protein TNIN_355571 [Trichonephila inaurata madagascariensis]